MSFLGFTSPAVSPTNLTYNIFSIPSGVYRYWREKRMLWPLAWATTLGTLPGIFIGAFIRVKYLPDPGTFKPFVGLVLLYIAVRLVQDILRRRSPDARVNRGGATSAIKPLEFNARRIAFEFENSTYTASTPGILLLSFIVGIIGGTYGIGGGAIIAPFFVAIYRLPVYCVAGATLFGTFVTSIFGVLFYSLLGVFYRNADLAIAPDWLLGLAFGIGGAAGMYVGARLQRFVPARMIKILLTVLLLTVALRYLALIF